ncbi:glucose-1-phosphate adenylyltransferase family protein [Brachybacterium paraconglomeratum]|uniref:glucose-1-phosphate adenylyltransferase family protein n=1 Tax=Brachybacterium paraconglomeratum TaxID=173362 RepID=UPI00223BD4F1|nr:sugar phosphate nucleotidyltransferase [Brachybacterium paraconglomeratum]MCT1438280.1 sugar phosphate nucleotidyltransferase [Brachybacterium paraconglomeratum]
MRIPRTLAIVLAGGQGSRMGALTDEQAKPALRVGGSYRLIDIALSNLANSHLRAVWVVEQYLPHSLNEHLSAGRPWDLDRTHDGLRTLTPFEGAEGEGFATGNSDTLWRQKELIAEFAPEIVLVLSADHLYTIDLLDVLDTHAAADAELTMVTTRLPQDASRHGVVRTGEGGIVEEFWYKPEDPPTDLVATEIFCFDAPALLEALKTLPERVGELQDWGDDLIPHFVERHRTVEHRLEGYWRDIGTLASYWAAHMHLLDGDGVTLDDPDWPIFSAQPQLLPARVRDGAAVSTSLLAQGSDVAGSVTRSVISPGAVVEAGAELVECVVLDGAHVGAGARLRGCLVQDDAQVPPGARLGDDDVVTLVGVDGTVAETTARE